MAKTASPYGLRPVRRLDGLPFSGQVRHLPIQSGYASDINPGDIVAVDNSGYVVRVSGTTTLGDGVVGVFVGMYQGDNGQTPVLAPYGENWKSGTTVQDAMAYVVDDPNVEFQVQANGSLDIDAVGKCFAIVNPSPSGEKTSKIALNSSSVGTTGPFKVVDMVRTVHSQPGDAYTEVIVKFNHGTHAYTSSTGVS